MEKNDFKDICTLLNFTLNDIHEERQQLEEYLTTLRLKLKKNPNNIKRRTSKINQKEFDDLALRPNLLLSTGRKIKMKKMSNTSYSMNIQILINHYSVHKYIH